MRELEEEIRRTVPPTVRAPDVSRAVTRHSTPSLNDDAKPGSRGLIPTLGLAAVLVVGGVVAWTLVKHVIVTLFWVAALGVVGWAGWKIWRGKKVKNKGKENE